MVLRLWNRLLFFVVIVWSVPHSVFQKLFWRVLEGQKNQNTVEEHANLLWMVWIEGIVEF